MVPVRPLAIRPSRFGYVTGGLALLLDAIIVVIIQLRGLVHRPSEAAIAALIVGGIALYGLNDLLVAAVARIAVDNDVVEVRSQFGRRRRFARSEVNRAARRSVFAPAQSGIYKDELLLVAKDGLCLSRLWEGDYSAADLERLVQSLGLAWPQSERASVRHVNRTFPGAHRVDYAMAAIVILVIVAIGLAVVTLALLTH
jgi:hypothetical protein